MRSSPNRNTAQEVIKFAALTFISVLLIGFPTLVGAQDTKDFFVECTRASTLNAKLVSRTKYFRVFAFRNTDELNDLYRYRVTDHRRRCKFEFLSNTSSVRNGVALGGPYIWSHAEMSHPMPVVDVGLGEYAVLLQSQEITDRFIVPELKKYIEGGCSRSMCSYKLKDWVSRNSFRLYFKIPVGKRNAFLDIFYVSGEIHIVTKRMQEYGQ